MKSEPVSGPSETHLPGVDSGLCYSARISPAEHHSGVTKSLLDSKVTPDNRTSANPEARPKADPSTSTTQGDLGRAEKVLGLPTGPGLLLATTQEGEIVYCPSSEYYSGSRRVNVIIDGLPYQSGRPVLERTIL